MEIVGLSGIESRFQHVEYRHAVLLLENHLSIQPGRVDWKPSKTLGYPAKLPCPVVAILGEQLDDRTINPCKEAIAIQLWSPNARSQPAA